MATKQPRLLHLIQGLEFPDYEYKEYPKVVEDHTGTKVTVKSKDEEQNVKTPPQAAQAPTMSLHTPATEPRLHPAQMTAAQREAKLAEMKKEMEELEANQTSALGGQPTGEAARLTGLADRPASTQAAGAMPDGKRGQGASGVPVTQKAAPGDHAAAKAEAEGLAKTPGGVVA